MALESDRNRSTRTEYFCAHPKGSTNPSVKKIETYCTRIGCPHLVNLAASLPTKNG